VSGNTFKVYSNPTFAMDHEDSPVFKVYENPAFMKEHTNPPFSQVRGRW